MKGRYAAAAMAVSGVYAQAPGDYGSNAPSSSVSPSISYTTVTYDECPSASMETMITVTNGITVTYCPECMDHHSTPKPTGPGYTTVYTTTYMSLCPTGMVPKTYTVTESCDEPEPTWTPGPSHIPQGFTVTEKVCHICDKTPTTVTMTEPCGCEAHEGKPGPPTPSPAKATPTGSYVSQIPDGQPQALGGAGGNSGSPDCNGDDCGGSSNSSSPPSGGNGGSNGGSTPPSGGPGGSSPSGGNGGSSRSGGSSPSCNGEDCGRSSNSGSSPAPGSYPGGDSGPMPTTKACSGANCRSMPTGGSAPGVNSTTPQNTGSMPPPPSEGMPPNSGASLAVLSTSIMAVVIAALAFVL